MSEVTGYLEETGLIYVLYRLKEECMVMEDEGKTLIANIPLNDEYVGKIFFGEGEEGVYTKTTLPVPTTDGKIYTQIIDVAVLSHLTFKEKALPVFDREMDAASKRKEEYMKAALSSRPLFSLPELHGACISGSLSAGRHPSPWCDIDYIIFTERDLKHRFSREWRRKPFVRKFSWTEFDYEAIDVPNGIIPPMKELLFEKEGAFDIDIIIVKPTAWVPALKSMPFGKRQHYLEILEDCYPLAGEAYIRNFYLSVK